MGGKKNNNKKAPLFHVHRSFLNIDDVERALWVMPWVQWRPCPNWLGDFKFHIIKPVHLPAQLSHVYDKLKTLVPEQKFNTVFLQKYDKGQSVKPHRDPKNNLGYTLIAPVGHWEGGETVLGKKTRFRLKPGDVLKLRCQVRGLQRPLHRMTPIISGTRYAIILNTVE